MSNLTASAEIVILANDRCNQENLIDQCTHGVNAMRTPVDILINNGAYMVMAALCPILNNAHIET